MTSSPDDPALYLYAQGHVALNLHTTGNGDVAATNLSHRYLYAPGVDSLLAFETFGGRDNPGNSGTGSYALYWTALDHQNSVRDVLTASGSLPLVRQRALKKLPSGRSVERTRSCQNAISPMTVL